MDTEERIEVLEQAVTHLTDALEKALAGMWNLSADAQKREIEMAGVLAVGLNTLARDCGADVNALTLSLAGQIEARRESGVAPHLLAPSEAILTTLRQISENLEEPG